MALTCAHTMYVCALCREPLIMNQSPAAALNSKSNTPRTDKIVGDFSFPWAYQMEMLVRHAEQLERELALAIDQRNQTIIDLGFEMEKNAALQVTAMATSGGAKDADSPSSTAGLLEAAPESSVNPCSAAPIVAAADAHFFCWTCKRQEPTSCSLSNCPNK